MEKLYLVDGSGYIFRAYYAIQHLSNSKGFPTNALFGFTRMLLKLLREFEVRNIAVVFDSPGPTFRHEMYDQYKANRKECPEDLVPQMPYFREIVRSMGIACLEQEGVEADDIIATLAGKFGTKDIEVVIVSADKDLTQLIRPYVAMYDAMKDVLFDEALVESKYGVPPQRIRDLLALIGDSSDNVPGVKGVGPKTAVRLLEELGDLESIIDNPAKIEEIEGLRGKSGVRKKVESDVEMLRLSRDLVSLREDVEPFNSMVNLEEFHWTAPDESKAEAVFSELEFDGLLGEFVSLHSSNGQQSNASPYEGKNYQLVDEENLASFLRELKATRCFAFDTETTGLDPRACDLLGISFSWHDDEAFYLPIKAKDSQGLALEEVRDVLFEIFANEEVGKIGFNLKFDAEVLIAHGFQVKGLTFDSLLASYVLHPDVRGRSLKNLALSELGERMQTYKEVVGKAEHLGQVALESVVEYACHDADASWQLAEQLDRDLKSQGEGDRSPQAVFYELEMPLLPVLIAMETAGIRIDTAVLDRLAGDFSRELKALQAEIHKLAGREFNVNSPKQLNEVLFQELELPTTGLKKTSHGFSTDASALKLLAEEHQIAAILLDYRELFKLNSTYVESLRSLVNFETSRVHTTFNQAVAATGRLSSSDPNLQNIPIRSQRGRELRKVFIAEDGHRLISADYSQIELRVLAHLSGDENLQQAFISGEDIHAKTAREIFSLDDTAEVLAEQRRAAKTINFGIIYGMSAVRLAGDLGITRKQAAQYIDNYFAQYPRVKGYYDDLTEQIESKGYVETLFGRRRYLEELNTSGRDAGFAVRSLHNAPLQGTAAEIIKRAMIQLHAQLAETEARLVLQVHDELVVETPLEIEDEVSRMVVSTMEGAAELSVPLTVEVKSGENWGEQS